MEGSLARSSRTVRGGPFQGLGRATGKSNRRLGAEASAISVFRGDGTPAPTTRRHDRRPSNPVGDWFPSRLQLVTDDLLVTPTLPWVCWKGFVNLRGRIPPWHRATSLP